MRISDAQIEEIKKGFIIEDESYKCLFCDQIYQMGCIYEIEGNLYDAYGAIKKHIEQEHISPVDYLLMQHTALLGISESQRDVLKGMWNKKNDKEIASACTISPSTVRNYKFKFREKQRQAKAYLALLEEIQCKLEQDSILDDNCIEVHDSAKMIDERFAITKEEYDTIVNSYIKDGRITVIPTKQKKKIVLLREILKQFDLNKEYSEKEVNEIIKAFNDDYSTLRRDLINYGFLHRSTDGLIYVVNKKKII